MDKETSKRMSKIVMEIIMTETVDLCQAESMEDTFIEYLQNSPVIPINLSLKVPNRLMLNLLKAIDGMVEKMIQSSIVSAPKEAVSNDLLSSIISQLFLDGLISAAVRSNSPKHLIKLLMLFEKVMRASDEKQEPEGGSNGREDGERAGTD